MNLRQRPAAVALIPATWAAWRLARSNHWAGELHARIGTHTRYWERLAERQGDVVFIAIGDSTAQGIGAREPAGSYVGQLERMLGAPERVLTAPQRMLETPEGMLSGPERRVSARLQVINLSISGARLADVISALLPRLARLDTDRALVTFAAGANDIADFDPDRFRRDLATIFDALPDHTLVAELPSFYVSPHQAKVREANRILHALAQERDLAVIPLHGVTNRFGPAAIVTHHARDLFHPNDRGYRIWARAFLGPASARLRQLAERSLRPA